ncbi:hypothetical protein M404DRAFT_1003964 [Pisolithus tinctorius Marx 270]|uniref:Uncharacterized protein n=1 Tax=Pisolithus tinctorius Marx 270 TaxID=870435 RepID=A0A0C3NYQ9_PISTI|nr:hypothetical protein M404DRAFT_1003964 [Pisolithus tinctorius Marx 270]
MSTNTGKSKKDDLPTSEYEDWEFEILDPVPPYSPEELLKIVDVLESPETKAALQKAVQDLGSSAYSIDISFNNVAEGLRKAHTQGTQAQRQQLQTFADNWAVHHKEYTCLLWESRRIAGHARVIANDFAGDFLSLMDTSDMTLSEKKAEIQAYRKQLDEDTKKSSDLSQRFNDLRKAVENFGDDMAEFLSSCRDIPAALQIAARKVATLKQEISKLDTALSWSIGISLGTAGIALAAIVLGVLCPPLWIFPASIGVLSARVSANVYKQRRMKKDKVAELGKQQMQLEERIRGLEGMDKIYATLDPMKSDIELIKKKLAVFGQIWQLIHVDLNAVEKGLELATNTAGVAMFKRRLQTTSKVYALLADTLYQYETNVHIQRIGKLED